MIEYFKDHPETVAMIVTAIVTILFKPRTDEQYEAMPRWMAQTLRAIAALGVDPVKFVKILTEKKEGPK